MSTNPSPSRLERGILLIRGQRVLLDSDLAALYGVTTKALKQAVKRNRNRFPRDFMFVLDWDEMRKVARVRSGDDSLRSHSVTLKKSGPSPSGTPSRRGAHRKFRAYAFTEQGVAMLSGVLRSPRAVRANVGIMRAFVRLRRFLADHEELARKLEALEEKYDGQFQVVFEAILELMEPPEPPPRDRIGFRP